MVSIFMLPWWQQALGVGGLVFPAVVIIGGCFAGVGWGMNRIGLAFLNRHVNEASSWQRAGMTTEAQAAFRKAMATFDSFWLSPLLRRGKLHWFSGKMARFYLGQHSSHPFIRSLVSTHLKHFPQDKAVAEPWLEQLLAYERHLPLEHEAVARVSAFLVKHQRMQRLLMQFYLANGRIDFDALQTYRRVWCEQQPLPTSTLTDLSHLLRNEYYLNAWALQVYLKAYAIGDQGAIEGIAAAVRWLPANEESLSHLRAAEKILGELDQQTLEQLDLKFKPVSVPPPVEDNVQARKFTQSATHQPPMRRIPGFLKKVNRVVDGFRRLFTDRRSQRTAAGFGLGAVLIITVVAGWKQIQHRPVEPVTQEAVKVPIEITDPFTIQVAAYLKAEDAQRFVDQLRQNEQDAFWTRAANAAGRTWYQVKVSHFADRQGAQQYGQKLKARGVIDDFYVANYEHTQRLGYRQE
jgi:cell division septation protein DedD